MREALRVLSHHSRESGGFARYLDGLGDFEATRKELHKQFAFPGDAGTWFFLRLVGRDVPEHEMPKGSEPTARSAHGIQREWPIRPHRPTRSHARE